jgi:hypothetical protein
MLAPSAALKTANEIGYKLCNQLEVEASWRNSLQSLLRQYCQIIIMD